MKNLQGLENGSIDKIKANLGQEEECEVKTYGVKGRSKDLELGSNRPVSSPIDPTHQIFLGIAKDLLPYNYNEMDPDHNAEINSFLESVDLTEEFKNNVRSLEVLTIFNIKEMLP